MSCHRILPLVAAAALSGCVPEPFTPESGIAGDGQLDVPLENIRQVFELPALGAIMVHQGEMIDAAVVGVRALGSDEQAMLDDEWLIGAMTMSVTATLAAILVERGVIDWDTTVGQVFPDLVYARPDYLDVSLEMLLRHRSGLPAGFDTPMRDFLYASSDPLPLQRRAWIEEILTQGPGVPGEYDFSLGGYVVAGAMLEEVAGASFEDLVQTEIFDALGMTGAGFGPAWSLADTTQPHGYEDLGADLSPYDPERFPLAADPAIGVHLTLADYATYLVEHIEGDLGTDGLVSSETFQLLHTTSPSTSSTGYGYGWGVTYRSWAPGVVLEHGGVAGGFNTVVWVAPSIELAMVAFTNAAAERTPSAIDNVLQVLLQRFTYPAR